ncbi:heat shock factor protein isoform X2 [Zootermopsis nevadensis]|uniref:heat shock factor protein isoform X2 n=1 Tax=Zootermopsis nevadensis TaxID=136037 RepID=UPI000B8EA059|nr:heat shock factor protein isoform X2 [Zootermopsis nevadensis]
MRSVEELGTNVPAFLAKLWNIVEDPETNDLICWSPAGTSFFIRNQARFSRELLPLYYKHNNMASFVRQLNMYGFHKVVSIECGGLRVDKDEMEFAHQCFLMGHPYLLQHIKRKIPTSKIEEGCTNSKPELMNKVLADVKIMKGRQDTLDSQLNAMKRENEVLWREVAILRQKHRKQQQIVNKLIQFLVTMVQSSRNGGIGVKRHYPLMLNDTSHRPSKISQLSAELSNLNSNLITHSPTGPVIHELDAPELLEGCEANPGEIPTAEPFLPSDFCSIVITDDAEKQNSTACLKPNEQLPGNSDCVTIIPDTEVLLEVAEECPLSPSLLLTASPMDVNSVIGIPKLSKFKGRARVNSNENKKRRSKIINSDAKKSVGADSVTPDTYTKALSTAAEGGIDFLDVVMPTTVEILEKDTNNEAEIDVEVGEDLLNPDRLAAATDVAISGITSVAAAGEDKSYTPVDSLVSAVSRSSFDEVLPVSDVTNSKCASTYLVDSAVLGNDASSSAKLNTSDLMGFKQKASTSHDEDGSPSNMVLACTGVNSEENCMDGSELDSHVDCMQNDLDSLRELLKGEGYSLDANTLLGLFGEDPFSATSFENLTGDRDMQVTSGSELATYSSNLLDMADMFGDSETGELGSPSTPESSKVMDITLSELNTPQMSIASPSTKKK